MKRTSKFTFGDGRHIRIRAASLLLPLVVLGCASKSWIGRGQSPVGPGEAAMIPTEVEASIDAENRVKFAQLKSLVANSGARSNVLVMPHALSSLACQSSSLASRENDDEPGREHHPGALSLCLRPAWLTTQVQERFYPTPEQSFQTDFLRLLQPSTPTYADPRGRYTISALELQVKTSYLLFLVPGASESLDTLLKELEWKEVSSALSSMPIVKLARLVLPRFSLRQTTEFRFELSEHVEDRRDPLDISPRQGIPVEGTMPEITLFSIDRPFLALVIDASSGRLMSAAAIVRPESGQAKRARSLG